MVAVNQFVQSLTKDLLGIYIAIFSIIFYFYFIKYFIRYMSMCHLVQHMTEIGMHQRILHVQKGDCADASKYWNFFYIFIAIVSLLLQLLPFLLQ